MRIGIDGVAEQQELQDRHAEHHGETQPVPAERHHFLDDNGAKPHPKATHRYPVAHDQTSAILSCAIPIRWMKMSSSVGSASCHCRVGSVRNGAIAVKRVPRSAPQTCRVVPKAAALTPGASRSEPASRSAPAPETTKA